MANNRYKFLTEEEEYETSNLLRNAFLAGKDGRDVNEIINGLLTTDEKIKLGRRIKIALMMLSGFSGEEIMDFLHVGRNSVTLVSKHLDKYPKCFELIKTREKKVDGNYKKKSYRKIGSSKMIFKHKEHTGFKRKDVKR